MSDGGSAVRRDEERGGRYEEYLDSLVEYLRDSSEENFSSLKRIAEEVDSIRGGYSSRQTHLTKTLDRKIELLKKGDETTWLKLLRALGDLDNSRLKDISPFPGQDITYLLYGYGFLMEDSSGPLLDMVHDELRGREINPFSGGSYAIVLPEETVEKMRELLKGVKVHKIG